MVQLGDGISVERAIQNLHNCFFFGSELRLRYAGMQCPVWHRRRGKVLCRSRFLRQQGLVEGITLNVLVHTQHTG